MVKQGFKTQWQNPRRGEIGLEDGVSNGTEGLTKKRTMTRTLSGNLQGGRKDYLNRKGKTKKGQTRKHKEERER